MSDETPAESPTAKRLRQESLDRKAQTMFPNFTGWSYIKAGLFSLVTLDGVLLTANAFPPDVTHYATIASLFLGAAGTIVTTLSGTTAGDAAVAKMMARKAGSK